MGDYSKAADTQIIADCIRGEARAWEELLRRYRRLIYSIPFKYHLSSDEAADVFQTVCVILLEHLGSLRDGTKLRSWLITTTTRECWTLKQGRNRQIADPSPEEEDPLLSVADQGRLPDEVLQTLEEQQLIRQGLDQLEERCRKLLTYLFYEQRERAYQDLSQELGMPVASIGPTRGRCLEKLKRILEKLGVS